MDCISRDAIQALQALTTQAASVVVAGHTHPDGDALGSTSALALYLQTLCGKHVTVVFPDSPADNLRFILPESVNFRFHDTEAEKAESSIRQADLVFLVDCNGFQRTEALQTPLETSRARKVLIVRQPLKKSHITEVHLGMLRPCDIAYFPRPPCELVHGATKIRASFTEPIDCIFQL